MKIFIFAWLALWYSAFIIYVFCNILFNGVYFLYENNHVVLYGELIANITILFFAIVACVNIFCKIRRSVKRDQSNETTYR